MYAVEDVGEASVVAQLLARGVRHADVRRAIERLAGLGDWPLSEAELWVSVPEDGGRPQILLRDDGALFALVDRGWQELAVLPAAEPVRVRLRGLPAHPAG